jgi:hypothetical protein
MGVERSTSASGRTGRAGFVTTRFDGTVLDPPSERLIRYTRRKTTTIVEPTYVHQAHGVPLSVPAITP